MMIRIKSLFVAVVAFFAMEPSFLLAQNSSLLHAPMPLGPVGGMGYDGARSVPGVGPLGAVMPPEFAIGGNAGAQGYPTPGFQSQAAQGLRPFQPATDPAVGLMGASWTYQPAPPMRAFRVQDIVMIRVDEIARMMAEGESDKRRIALFQAALTDWIQLGRGGLVPDPQVDGDPTVNGQSRTNSRSESSIESRESMSFNIAARIVDIRPNGNLVLEARKNFRVNDNLWETSLSGICRAQDIGPDNVVLSRNLIDLEIHKQDQGQLRDGYKRGWLQRAFDQLKPF